MAIPEHQIATWSN